MSLNPYEPPREVPEPKRPEARSDPWGPGQRRLLVMCLLVPVSTLVNLIALMAVAQLWMPPLAAAAVACAFAALLTYITCRVRHTAWWAVAQIVWGWVVMVVFG
jgi:hypothetical protein